MYPTRILILNYIVSQNIILRLRLPLRGRTRRTSLNGEPRRRSGNRHNCPQRPPCCCPGALCKRPAPRRSGRRVSWATGAVPRRRDRLPRRFEQNSYSSKRRRTAQRRTTATALFVVRHAC